MAGSIVTVIENMLFYRAFTYTWGCSSVGRALEWHSRGRRFDPDQLHHFSSLFAGCCILFKHPAFKVGFLARRRSDSLSIQYGRKRGLWGFAFFSFFLVLSSVCLHMLQRVSLQHWQKLQSGQGFFLRRIIFPMVYFNLLP